MKTKKILSLLLAIVMILSCFAALGVSASAAEAGTTVSNPIVLREGVMHTKYWTSDNDDLACYNKIVVPARGYITFAINKPYDDEGEAGSFKLFLYSSNGKVMWNGTTYGLVDSFIDTYVMKIGVAAGTYYLNIDPSFYLYRDSAPIKTFYKYKFTKTNNWEIEPNNAANTATQMSLNTVYNGVYCEETYDTSYQDWFKVNLVRGRSYKFCIGNYEELHSGTLIADVYDPNNDETDIFYNLSNNPKYSRDRSVRYITYKAPVSGTYYIQFYNDGNSAPVQYSIGVYEVGVVSYTGVPSKVAVSASDTSVKVSWSAASGASGYKVYLYNGSKCVASKVTTARSYTFTKLSRATTYKVYVKAYKNANGKAVYSSKKAGATVTTKPGTPTLSVAAGSKKAVLKWSKRTEATGYVVYMATSKTGKYTKIATIKKNSTVSMTKTGLKTGKAYYFKVASYKSVSGKVVYSAWSSVRGVKIK